MSFFERAADLQYKAFDAMRSRKAEDVATGEAEATDFEGLRGARQCIVATYKRSGEAVPTPVNFGLSDEGRLYFRSEPRSAKVRRIGNDPRVRVAPCTMRGKPKGLPAEGDARVLPAAEAGRARAILAANWDAPTTAIEKGLERLPLEIVYVEVTPAGSAPAEEVHQ